MEAKLTCLGHFIGSCKGCSEDYDNSHHPNNYDCPHFTGIRVLFLEVKPIRELEEYENERNKK